MHSKSTWKAFIDLIFLRSIFGPFWDHFWAHFGTKIDPKSIEKLIRKVIHKMIASGSDFRSDFGRQDGPKTGSRGRQDGQDGPKRPQDGPPGAPRRPQEASKKRIPAAKKTGSRQPGAVLAAWSLQGPPRDPSQTNFGQFLSKNSKTRGVFIGLCGKMVKTHYVLHNFVDRFS